MEKIDELYAKMDRITNLISENGIDLEIKSYNNDENEVRPIYTLNSSLFKDYDDNRRLKCSYDKMFINHHLLTDKSIIIDLVCEYFYLLKKVRIEKKIFINNFN